MFDGEIFPTIEEHAKVVLLGDMDYIRKIINAEEPIRFNKFKLSPMQNRRAFEMLTQGWSLIQSSDNLPHNPEMLKSFGVIRNDV